MASILAEEQRVLAIAVVPASPLFQNLVPYARARASCARLASAPVDFFLSAISPEPSAFLPMTPNEIFAQMSAAASTDLFAHVLEKEKPLYKAAIEKLAQQRKLRPVFVERKPRNERHAWLKDALGRRQNEGVAAHLLQIWLVGKHKDLLCDFLDALGIKHDENGTMEELPPSPSHEDLLKAIDAVLQKHDREVVAIYLHAFQAFDEKGWDALAGILGSDERLRLGEPVVA